MLMNKCKRPMVKGRNVEVKMSIIWQLGVINKFREVC